MMQIIHSVKVSGLAPVEAEADMGNSERRARRGVGRDGYTNMLAAHSVIAGTKVPGQFLWRAVYQWLIFSAVRFRRIGIALLNAKAQRRQRRKGYALESDLCGFASLA